MEVCAGELRGVNGIHVTAVVPPPTDTRLWMSAFPAVDRSTLASASALAPLYVELLGERGAAHHGGFVVDGLGYRFDTSRHRRRSPLLIDTVADWVERQVNLP